MTIHDDCVCPLAAASPYMAGHTAYYTALRSGMSVANPHSMDYQARDWDMGFNDAMTEHLSEVAAGWMCAMHAKRDCLVCWSMGIT